MIYFEKELEKSSMLRNIEQAEKSGIPVQINGCVDSQISHLTALLSEHFAPAGRRLIITCSEDRAGEIYNDLHGYDSNVMLYPAKDALFYSADVRGGAITGQRLDVMRYLCTHKKATVITTTGGILDRVIPLEVFKKSMFQIKKGDTLNLTETAEKLVHLGYERNTMVSHPGQFAIRGDILDIFSCGDETPARIELWGEDVDNIRSFDAESQRSIEELEKLRVFPACEMPMTDEVRTDGIKRLTEEYEEVKEDLRIHGRSKAMYNLVSEVETVLDGLKISPQVNGIDSFTEYFYPDSVSLLDYFKGEGNLIFLDEPTRSREALDSIEDEFTSGMDSREKEGYILPGQKNVFFDRETIVKRLSSECSFYYSGIGYADSELKPASTVEIRVQRTNTYRNNFDLLLTDLRAWHRDKYRMILVCSNAHRGNHMVEELASEGIESFFVRPENLKEVAPGSIAVTVGALSCGFLYPDDRLAVISENDVFHDKKRKKKRTHHYTGERIKSFDDLSVGDYVVHEDRGVGIYRGIEQREYDGITKDYIAIEYAGGGMLYVEVSQMQRVQRYSGADGTAPKLNKLSGNEWNKTKARVSEKVNKLAEELVELYAVRSAKKGFACAGDDMWQRDFEERFPYDETEDQLKAIKDTKKDMESTKIMDRLICGDVGYGKTEVALRAAFKAVENSKQVAYLVPTTVLAEQHYRTFTERMKGYPITIKMLSRFQKGKEAREIIEGLNDGSVDIVIGTHRLFSKDVHYKDLGLLIIDEEQRFGVAHKEKIKEMKKDVDVLTLTATPIPRTLHMSLAGIRDMSVLSEPPVNRRPIQTYVMEYNPEIVKEAVKREIARGGQVYYIYNRVSDIDKVAESVRQLLPTARVAFAHGQMRENELEDVMMSFIHGDIDVLVSTTIIETGIDIPNVNTIIVHDSDRYGLAQLYQLRGRVGRGARRAYAFLMYRKDKLINETAQKRLSAIREFTDLGSGMKIAMRDLEIRGAGNLLGADQSGHMEAVGYDLYCKMLNNAVTKLKGGIAREVVDTQMILDVNAYIPASYVKDEFQKLELYKRIASISDEDQQEDMKEELKDRYGEIPEETLALLDIALVKARAADAGIEKIVQKEGQVEVYVHPAITFKPLELSRLVRHSRGSITWTESPKRRLTVKTGHLKWNEIIPVVAQIVKRVAGMEEDRKLEVKA